MNSIINCQEIAQNILDSVRKVTNKKQLAVISFGQDKVAESCLKGLRLDCQYCGIKLKEINFSSNEKIQFVSNTIHNISYDDTVGGILTLRPIPEQFIHIVRWKVLLFKDIDAYHFSNVHGTYNCVTEAVFEILKSKYKDLTGLNVLLIGKGIVGKSVLEMLLNEHCTVTITHSKTNYQDLWELINQSQLIISAVGKPVVDGRLCYNNTIIDCGISYDKNNHIQGDLYNIDDMQSCQYTSVPNGVGLVTRAILLRRLVEERIWVYKN